MEADDSNDKRRFRVVSTGRELRPEERRFLEAVAEQLERERGPEIEQKALEAFIYGKAVLAGVTQ